MPDREEAGSRPLPARADADDLERALSASTGR
jgi:hypothetical protein